MISTPQAHYRQVVVWLCPVAVILHLGLQRLYHLTNGQQHDNSQQQYNGQLV